MAKKRTAQLEQEIQEALARIPRKPGLKTREQLDAEIDAVLAGGLPAERHDVARALGFQYPKRQPPKQAKVTDLNIFALSELVIEAGGATTFSNRVHATGAPHIKRAIAGGLVTVSSPTTLTLTPEGRDAVLARLRRDYAAQSDVLARDPSRFSARDRERLEQQRVVIERLEAAA